VQKGLLDFIFIFLLLPFFHWTSNAAGFDSSVSHNEDPIIIDDYKNHEKFIGSSHLWWPGRTDQQYGNRYELFKCSTSSYEKCKKIFIDLDQVNLSKKENAGKLRLRPGYYQAIDFYGLNSYNLELSHGDLFSAAPTKQIIVDPWEGSEEIKVKLRLDLSSPRYKKRLNEIYIGDLTFPLPLKPLNLDISPNQYISNDSNYYYQICYAASKDDAVEGITPRQKEACKSAIKEGELSLKKYQDAFFHTKFSTITSLSIKKYQNINLYRNLTNKIAQRLSFEEEEKVRRGLYPFKDTHQLKGFLETRRDLILLKYSSESKMALLAKIIAQKQEFVVAEWMPTGNEYSLFYGDYIAEFANEQDERLLIPFRAEEDSPPNISEPEI